MIPFGLRGVDQVSSIDVNLGVRVSEPTSPGAVRIKNDLILIYLLILHSMDILLSGVLIVKGCSENGPVPMLFTAATNKEYSVKGTKP